MDIIDKCLMIFYISMLAAIFVCGVLQIIFFLLKLYGAIDWSWMLVFLPSVILVAISGMGLVVTSYEGV